MIYTTKGWLDDAEVELKPTVTDDERAMVTRTDKYLRATGEWVGNDLDIKLKQPMVSISEVGGVNG